MTSRRIAAVLLTALALAFSGLTVATPTATSAAPKTVYFNMYAHGTVKPKRIYLSADAGPWLKKLTWSGWGKARTVGTGTYVSNCASCAGPERREATLWFSKPVLCTKGEGKGLRTYRKAVLILSEPDEGSDQRVFSIPTGCP